MNIEIEENEACLYEAGDNLQHLAPGFSLVAMSDKDRERLEDYLEAVEGDMEFDDQGTMIGIKGVDWRLVDIIHWMYTVTKKPAPHQVTIKFDAWAVNQDAVREAITDALENFGLDKSREVVTFE